MIRRYDENGNHLDSDSELVNSYLKDKYFTGDLSDDALASARQTADQRKLIAGLGEGASTIAAGLSGSKPQTDFYNRMAANADSGVKDIETRRKSKVDEAKFAQDAQKFGMEEDKFHRERRLEQSDSPESLTFQAAVKRAAPGLFTDDELTHVTAADEKRVDTLAKLKETAAARLEAAHIAADAKKANANAGLDEKTAKRFTMFGDALDPDKFRAGNFAQQQAIVYNAKKLDALASQFPDGNMPPAQVAELAQSTANMLSGGNHAAESTVERYVPKTIGRTAADIQQWITNEPKGAGQQAFVKQMLETAARERELAENNVRDIKYRRVAQFSDLEKKDPETFNSILLSHEIEPEDYGKYKANGYKIPAKPPTPAKANAEDQQAIEWAKANPNDPRAKRIMSLHGGM